MSELVNAGNNFMSRLAYNLSSSDNTLTVVDEYTKLPETPFLLTINNGKENMEIVKVVLVLPDDRLAIERAQEGTTAQEHEAGSIVENNFTAGTYQALVDEINRSIRVVDSEIGDDYILKKYSDGTFELKGNMTKVVSLTNEINGLYRSGNMAEELLPISDASYKLMYSNAFIMDGNTNSFLVTSFVANPLEDKSIRYRIMGNNTSPTEDAEFIIGYEAYGTWS